eukprot:TRINITY_DN21210_c1_g1_i3.p1 TRINITY_DN21210_c1_g1~~TRINITY_DN21210_c1_g1_i3.p1  ORF type:complete len:250 (-),score=15.31 TRINITY_DN21210_c1_g1_i3:133-882(-)
MQANNNNAEEEQGLENFFIPTRLNALYNQNRLQEMITFPNSTGQMVNGQIRLRSVRNRQSVYIRFVNCTNTTVGTIWVNFQGNEWTYNALLPQATYRQQTFQRHLWVARSIDGGHRMCLTGNFPVATDPSQNHTQTQQIVMLGSRSRHLETIFIVDPPLIRWKQSLHNYFPGEFKTYVRETLLTLHKLIQEKVATNFELTQHLVHKIIGFLAPPVYFDISRHGQDAELNDNSVSRLLIRSRLHEMIVNN